MSQPEPPQTFEIPVVERLPEFEWRHAPIPEITNYLLTRLFDDRGRILHADYDKYGGKWFVQKRYDQEPTPEELIVETPSRGMLRTVLARFGAHYMASQLYGGYSTVQFRQRDIVHGVAIYMGNDSWRGFWLRAYARPV